MSRPALNLTALVEFERAAESMVAFSFTDVEYKESYGAALKAFLARKRRLRMALVEFQESGLVRVEVQP